MKKIIFFILLLVASLNITAQKKLNPAFNQSFADSLGADQYGMKMYVFVILKTGKTVVTDKKKGDSLFMGHMTNINRLVKINKLVVAGPFETNEKKYEGIFILNAGTIAEANGLLETDPAIKSGLLDVELYQWYGSAALPMYLKYHDNVKKNDF